MCGRPRLCPPENSGSGPFVFRKNWQRDVKPAVGTTPICFQPCRRGTYAVHTPHRGVCPTAPLPNPTHERGHGAVLVLVVLVLVVLVHIRGTVEAHALPTSPQAQQQQQDVINRILAA